MRFRSRIYEWDLYGLTEWNKLYEIVKLFGGYRWYKEQVDESAFTAFYNRMNQVMKHVFVNKANAELRTYFFQRGMFISSNKMKKLLITSKKVL